MPYCLKYGVVVMVSTSDSTSDDVTNRRPITLLSEIGKLVNRDLKETFTEIFHTHPEVLDQERTYHHDGTSRHCVRSFVDMCEDFLEGGADVDLIFTVYDFDKAFDLIRPFSLESTCRRFNLTPSFTVLVMDMFSSTQSCVRTKDGLSNPSNILTSVRQDDPLSAILFILFVNSLHTGCRDNPLVTIRSMTADLGYDLLKNAYRHHTPRPYISTSYRIFSLDLGDDTGVATQSWETT
jgi:hypothetical protein